MNNEKQFQDFATKTIGRVIADMSMLGKAVSSSKYQETCEPLTLELEMTQEGGAWAGVAKLRGQFSLHDLEVLGDMARGVNFDLGRMISSKLGHVPGRSESAESILHQIDILIESSKRGQQYREALESAFRQIARRHGETPPVPGLPQELLDGVLHWASQEVDETLAKLQGEIEEVTGEVLEGDAIVAYALEAIAEAYGYRLAAEGKSYSIKTELCSLLGLPNEASGDEMYSAFQDKIGKYEKLNAALCGLLGLSDDTSIETLVEAVGSMVKVSTVSIDGAELRKEVIEALCLRDDVSRKDLIDAVWGMSSEIRKLKRKAEELGLKAFDHVVTKIKGVVEENGRLDKLRDAYDRIRDIVGGDTCDTIEEVVCKADSMRQGHGYYKRGYETLRSGIEGVAKEEVPEVEPTEMSDKELLEFVNDQRLHEICGLTGQIKDLKGEIGAVERRYERLRSEIDGIFGTAGHSDATALNMIRDRGAEVSGQVAELRYLLENMRWSATLSSEEANRLSELGRAVKDRKTVQMGNLTQSAWPFQDVLNWAERVNASVQLVDDILGSDPLVPEDLAQMPERIEKGMKEIRDAVESKDVLGALQRLSAKAKAEMPIEGEVDFRAKVEAETSQAIDSALREMCMRIGYGIDEEMSAEEICRGVATSLVQIDDLARFVVSERNLAELEGRTPISRIAEFLNNVRDGQKTRLTTVYQDLLSLLRERVGQFEAAEIVQDMPPRTLVDALAARQQSAEEALSRAMSGATRIRCALIDMGIGEDEISDRDRDYLDCSRGRFDLSRYLERTATEAEKYVRRGYRLTRSASESEKTEPAQ